jgi:hypothetical protein
MLIEGANQGGRIGVGPPEANGADKHAAFALPPRIGRHRDRTLPEELDAHEPGECGHHAAVEPKPDRLGADRLAEQGDEDLVRRIPH